MAHDEALSNDDVPEKYRDFVEDLTVAVHTTAMRWPYLTRVQARAVVKEELLKALPQLEATQ